MAWLPGGNKSSTSTNYFCFDSLQFFLLLHNLHIKLDVFLRDFLNELIDFEACFSRQYISQYSIFRLDFCRIIMVLFKHVLIEKEGRVLSLENLDLKMLYQVKANGGWNGIDLENDRILYFDKTYIGKYEEYDVNVLKDSGEIYHQAILFKRNIQQIDESIARKKFLLNNMFIKTNLDRKNQPDLSCSNENEQSNVISEKEFIKKSSIATKSIVHLRDDEISEISFDKIVQVSDQFICDELSDDDDGSDNEIVLEHTNVIVCPEEVQENQNENELPDFIKPLLQNQQKILNQVKKCLSQFIIKFLLCS